MMVNNVINWAKVLGSVSSGAVSYTKSMALRKVYVHNGVANVCNGLVLIRRAIDAPDGYYVLDPKGNLAPSGTAVQYPYPHIEEMMPDFAHMRRLELRREDIQNMIMFTNSIAEDTTRGVNSRLVVFDATEARHAQEAHTRFPLPGSPVDLEIGVQACALRFALTEMLLYESVYLAYDNRAAETKEVEDFHGNRRTVVRPRPLFIGLDWGHCAIVSAVKPAL